MSQLYPEDTLIKELWLPSMRAAQELQKGNAAQAIQQLQAAALVGEAAKSRRAYEDLFAVYKTADPDLPILIEAKRQYGKR